MSDEAHMQESAEPGAEEVCDLDDCACTGKNIGKFTSPAALLAIAERECLSGYDMAERLRSMPLGGETGPDSGGLYRTLRRMERFNLVTSEWDTEGGGPARRLYSLTNLGDACLDRWAETLRDHRDAIQAFLEDFEELRRDGESGGRSEAGESGEGRVGGESG
ncbi:MAG: helix-turn-helix transcriptional regulator [Actinobacteria bacterium]|nr:helix-turn-helix transcriptional regulator [Actinomycetota bacterium]